jgi:phosphomannomutase
LTQDLFRRVGTFYFRRHQVPLTRRLENLLERRREQEWHEVNGWKVVSTDLRDGLKLTFEGGSWILIRKAGTEPKLRIYAEGRTKEEMRTLMHLAKKVLTNWRLGHV